MVQGPAIGVALEAQTSCSIGLGVAVHNKCLEALLSQGCPQIDSGGRFSNPTFLIGHSDDATQMTPVLRRHRKFSKEMGTFARVNTP